MATFAEIKGSLTDAQVTALLVEWAVEVEDKHDLTEYAWQVDHRGNIVGRNGWGDTYTWDAKRKCWDHAYVEYETAGGY